jgi:hypothetical protein
MVELARIVWADGPGGMPYEPSKALIRQWGTWLENLTTSLGMAVTSAYIRGTKAQLDAVSGESTGDVGIVVADDNAALRGVYVYSGGVWQKKLDLPVDAAQEAADIAEDARDVAIDARDDAIDARDDAVAAKNIAEGYASDAVSQGNVPIYGTAIGLSSLTIPAGINFIRTNGYAAADGRGAALYRLMAAPEATVPGELTSNSGSKRWALAAGQDIHLEMFGALPYTYDDLIALNGNASINARAAQNSAALTAADALAVVFGGAKIRATGQFYVLSSRYERSAGVFIIGDGVGEWEPIYPQRPKTWEGTTFLFKGTGTKDVTFDGITSGEKSGGWRPDPDNAGSFIKLWSAYNSDATGTTPATKKQYSVGVLVKETVRYGGLQDLRICNWVGSDGISDWSNQAMLSLGDNWDFGYVRRNAEYADDRNLQVVGGFREAAGFQTITAISESTGERNTILRGKFSSRRGLMVRGPDIIKVQSTSWNAGSGVGTITLPWTSENYHGTTGILRGSDGRNYAWTGMTHAGSDANMVLTGVTPDPTGILSLRHPSSGLANTEYDNCYIYGLDHVSGQKAAYFGFPDSRAFEVSGYPIRGLKFDLSSKFHTNEKVIAHIHHATDLTMFSHQFEGGGHVIASPDLASQTWAVAPIWETRGLVIIGSNGLSDGVDARLFTPRNALLTELQLSPRSDLTGHTSLTPMAGKDAIIQNKSGSAQVRAYDGGTVSVITGGVGRIQFFSTGSVGAGADNSQSLGTAALRWNQLYAGTATINTSDERSKQDIAALPDAWLDAWGDIEWMGYRWRDAVAEKGEAARFHVGLIAQQVRDVFSAHGIDAMEIGLLCYDEWERQDAVFEDVYDSDGNLVGRNIVTPAVEAGGRYGLRYSECFAIEAAYQRRRMARIEKELASISKGIA